MSVPLPKELVREAWKARVGYSWESRRTHLACISDQHYAFSLTSIALRVKCCEMNMKVVRVICMSHN